MAEKQFTCTVDYKAVTNMRIAMLRISDRLDEIAIAARAADSHVGADVYTDDQLYAMFGLLRRCAEEARAEVDAIETLSRMLHPEAEAANG